MARIMATTTHLEKEDTKLLFILFIYYSERVVGEEEEYL